MKDLREKNNPTIKVWDLPIRMFHWGLVAAIAASFISMELGNMEVHVISGASVLGLLIFRVLWGIWGSSTARFFSFIPSPKALMNHFRTPDANSPVTIGHSPLAALSVVGMLLAIGFQAISGLVADDDVYTTGPLVDYVESDFSEWVTGLHATNSDIVLGLIALHVAAIVFYKLVKKQGLTKPMVTGNSVAHAKNIEVTNPLVERPVFVFLLTATVSVAIPYVLFNFL